MRIKTTKLQLVLDNQPTVVIAVQARSSLSTEIAHILHRSKKIKQQHATQKTFEI
jgi:hypothetical protein